MSKNHDQLFKELLTTFFQDFIQLFFPEIHDNIQWSSLTFLSSELYSDTPKRKQVDLLAKVRLSGDKELFILIHTEHQAQPQANFEKRMFLYFCYLTATYELPILPIALLSYARPQRPEPSSFTLRLLNKVVVDFHYQVIQLNQLCWRDFLRHHNPVATALMARMRIDIADRPKVKLECLRLLATLQLDAPKQSLIIGFVENYLKLDAAERAVLQEELSQISPEEATKMLKLTNQWFEEGEAKGIAIGEAKGIAIGEAKGVAIGEAKGIAIGEAKGIAAGEANAHRKTVLNLHHRGFDAALIASVTELSLPDVQRFISQADSSPNPT